MLPSRSYGFLVFCQSQHPYVAGERVVPELIQDEVTPERLADEALTLIENEHVRETMITKLHGITLTRLMNV